MRATVNGLLTAGLGTATIAAALGGGIPATVAATICLAGCLALEHAEHSQSSPTVSSGTHAWGQVACHGGLR
ncbi:MAG: hypothetical protein ACYCW6_00815 [Candidatus Xenobia bacterium]